MTNNARNQYLQTQILTASKEQLVLMLYDGAVRFCETAKNAWKNDNDLETAHKSLVKAQDIVLELAYSLNKQEGGELANKMAQLYAYCYSRLVTANLQRSEKIVSEVQNIISDLRDGWSKAMENIVKEDTENQAELSSGKAPLATETAPAQKPSAAAPSAPNNGKVLAKIPIAKVPASEAKTVDNKPRISVQG